MEIHKMKVRDYCNEQKLLSTFTMLFAGVMLAVNIGILASQTVHLAQAKQNLLYVAIIIFILEFFFALEISYYAEKILKLYDSNKLQDVITVRGRWQGIALCIITAVSMIICPILIFSFLWQ